MRLIFSFVMAMATFSLYGQMVIGGLSPDTSAMLDVQGSDRGVLFPRMTAAERDSIVLPATSLLIFNKTSGCLEINLGTAEVPLWADVKCPGVIESLDCGEAVWSQNLISGASAAGTVVSVPYSGGNGGGYGDTLFMSSGVEGLTAALPSGSLVRGSGNLELLVSGTPANAGEATFMLSIGGSICQLSVSVEPIAPGADTCGAYIAPGVWKTFLCHNLASANTQADPSSPGWEINGGYWQWGRKGPDVSQWLSANTPHFAHGPTGATTALANEASIAGWSDEAAAAGAWMADSKTANDPCPQGFRIPSQADWSGVLSNNAQTIVGTWSGSATNYSSGRFFGDKLFLPASGYRYLSAGWLIYRGLEGRYWSSDQSSHLEFTASGAAMSTSDNRSGYSIRCLSESVTAQVGSLQCSSATVSAAADINQSVSGISLTVPYTSGNGATYPGQSVTSTGITGLTATLQPGTLSTGSGSLIWALSGTPQQSGTAQFSVSFGAFSCTLPLTVNEAGNAPGTYPTGFVHCDPANPTVVNDVTNPTTGKIWMDRNLGAARVATSYNDAQAYGDLYQWGRFADGHQCRNSATTSVKSAGDVTGHGDFITGGDDWRTQQNDFLWQGVNGTNNPCPEGYRLPTETEWNAERQSWNSNSRVGAFASPLKLPVSGVRSSSSGGPFGVGSVGYYWSSSVSGSNARYLGFYSSNADMSSYARASGIAVRCLKD